jgi:hypothetical protein
MYSVDACGCTERATRVCVRSTARILYAKPESGPMVRHCTCTYILRGDRDGCALVHVLLVLGGILYKITVHTQTAADGVLRRCSLTLCVGDTRPLYQTTRTAGDGLSSNPQDVSVHFRPLRGLLCGERPIISIVVVYSAIFAPMQLAELQRLGLVDELVAGSWRMRNCGRGGVAVNNKALPISRRLIDLGAKANIGNAHVREWPESSGDLSFRR